MRRDLLQLLYVASILALALHCRPVAARETVMNASTHTEMRRAISTWMNCIECDSAELDSVLRFDDAAVPTLSAILRHGPSPAMLEARRGQFAADFEKMAEIRERIEARRKVK